MASGRISVRPARYTDWAALEPIFQFFAAQHHAWHPGQFRPAFIGVTTAIFQSWLELPDQLHIVAELDGELVGYADAARFNGNANELMFARRGVHVAMLMVAPRAHRRGIGRALFEAIETWGEENDAEIIGLSMSPQNATAAAFYAAMGYDVVNEYRLKVVRRVRRFTDDP